MNNKYPDALENLIESFEHLPSVGRKTAERYALYVFMHMKDEDIVDFSNALNSLHYVEQIAKTPLRFHALSIF